MCGVVRAPDAGGAILRACYPMRTVTIMVRQERRRRRGAPGCEAVGGVEDAVEFIVRGGDHGFLSFCRCPDT
jgi:hypothetical protein